MSKKKYSHRDPDLFAFGEIDHARAEQLDQIFAAIEGRSCPHYGTGPSEEDLRLTADKRHRLTVKRRKAKP